ncbi:MAG: HAD-IA family hydrolase [Candidatus Bathyarchaeota archaeon]|nr:MAG: HAD-IA family hydrolase [Candidatus Bathyarchaeota archaeon]
MSRFETLIFDFDYTLADSSRGIIECVNHALGKLGLPRVTEEATRRTVGLSLPETLVALAGREHADKGSEFTRLFIERADEVMADLTVVFDFVPQVIEWLKRRGYTLGIISTKYRYRIEAVLGREGLLHLFDVIVGGEDVSNHKPDPESLLAALGKLGSPSSSVLYVGDSVTDARAAESAGVAFVAVLSGVTQREAFSGYPVLAVIDSIVDLEEIL